MPVDGKPTFLGQDARKWMLKYFSFLIEEFGFQIAWNSHTELTQGKHDHTAAAVGFVRGDRRFEIFYWEGREKPELYLTVEKGDFSTPYAKNDKQSIVNILYHKNIDFDFYANLPVYTHGLDSSLRRYAEILRDHCMDVLLGEAWYPEDQSVYEMLRKKSSSYRPVDGRTGRPLGS
jgi:hypothetical protein